MEKCTKRFASAGRDICAADVVYFIIPVPENSKKPPEIDNT
jgi:hypothetical protein